MRRRDFLKLVATSTTGAVLFTGCQWGDGDPEREFKIESPVLNPNDVVFRQDNWYATTCRYCGGDCGLIVRVYEGRAKKVEGNPDFPTNMGSSCARAQAAVQELYHPDRVASPMRVSGNRGSGQFQPVSWDDAIGELAGFVSDAAGTDGAIVLMTEPPAGAFGRVVNEFAAAFGARQVSLEPDERVVLREAMRRVFGVDSLPALDLANARSIVSFSADFLHDWISPTQFSRGYGEFRQGRADVRGSYYHVGPHFNGSAANADKWFPINPGTEGLVALAMAQVITSEGLVEGADAGAAFGDIDLNQYSPDTVADATGLSAEQIRDLARRFASEQPGIAIAGTSAAAHTNGLFNLTAVFALNLLVGSAGGEGGIIFNPPSPLGDDLPANASGQAYRDLADVISAMNSGAVQVLIVHGVDPVYSLPAGSGFREALANVPHVVSLTSFVDDTAAMADLVLPVHTSLEDWDVRIPDPGPGFEVIGLQQPVVNPFVTSESAGDVLLRVAAGAQQPLPWNRFEDAVRETVEAIRGLGRGNIQADSADEFFIAVQAQGGWWDTGSSGPGSAQPSGQLPAAAEPQFAGDAGQFPLHLLPFPSNSLGYGRTAHLPWMQALPEPVSTGVWSTWIELNPRTADEYGVDTGDVVRVTSPTGVEVEVPVYVNPAAHPNVAAIPMGQGHTHFTRYAEGRGVNPLDIIDPQVESETGALAWAATRVRLEATGRKVRLPRFEGQLPAFQAEETKIIQVTRATH